MFFGTNIFMMDPLVTDVFPCTGGGIRPRSTRPGMVMGCYKSLAGMLTSKTSQDVIWEEHLAIHLPFLAPSYP